MGFNPTLIFANTNNDPVTAKILNKLTIKLKNLGYEVFFDDVPKGSSIQEQLAQSENNLKIYDQLETQFKSRNLTITNPDDLQKFVTLTIMSMGIALARYSAQDFLTHIGGLIDHHPSVLAFHNLLETLQKNQIDYQGIKPVHLDRIESISLMYALDRYRDETLADTYLNTSQSVFGQVDLAHISAIQRDILKRISHDEATARFCFFNIYSKPQPHPGILPLGMINIDAENKSEEEIVSLVVKEMLDKCIQLKKFISRETLVKDAQEIDFESFKEAYFKRYDSTFFLFKNPFSKMRRSLQNNEISSMEDVIRYAELYPNTRTGEVIRSIKKP